MLKTMQQQHHGNDHAPTPVLLALTTQLTPRQRAVIAAVACTDTVGEAATRLGVSAPRLTASLRTIAARLGLPDQTSLVRLVRRQALLDDLPDSVFLLDANDRCRYANREAARLFGYDVDTLVSEGSHDLLHHSGTHGSPSPKSDCAIAEAVTSGVERTGHELLFRSDGTPVWCAFRVEPAGHWEDEAVAVVTLSDETEELKRAADAFVGEARWDLALRATQTVTFEIDVETGDADGSGDFARLLGITEERADGLTFDTFAGFVHPDDRAVIELSTLQELAPNVAHEHDLRIVREDGQMRRLRGSLVVLADRHGIRSKAVGVAVDITERHDSDEVDRMLLSMSTDAYIGADAAGLVTEWNATAERVFGYPAHAAIGRTVAELIIPERDHAAHDAAVARLDADRSLLPRITGPIILTARHADGSEFPVEASLATFVVGDGLAFRAVMRDVSALEAERNDLRLAAVTDEVTGVANRRGLTDRLAEHLRDADHDEVAVLWVDLDHFKVVNDTLGHEQGDAVLRTVATRLVAALRDAAIDGVVARFASDEFVIVCPGVVHLEQAIELADRANRAIAAAMTINGRELYVSASIGVAATTAGRRFDGLVQDGAGRARALLGQADAAMSRAKARGRSRVEVFDDALRYQVSQRLDLETALRKGIENDELRVHYQPVVDLSSALIIGAEALVRWERPGLGLVSPADFIPLAEETGLIVALGEFVIEESCRQLAEWDSSLLAAGLDMAVNVSARQFGTHDFVERFGDALRRHRLDGDRLYVEVTESVLVDELTPVESVLRSLQALGVRVALDDFGTGYCSMMYLRSFPVGVLKLDRQFVAGLGESAQDTAIVRSVIDLAHALGMKAHAEGVERLGQLEMLRDMGCDFGQGYLWSKPLPADSFERLLRAQARPELVSAPAS